MQGKMIAAFVGVVSLSGAAFAVPVYSTGFEPISFTSGNLAGQNSWATSGSGPALVQTDVVKTGTQAVSLANTSGSQKFAFVPLTVTPNTTTQRYVYVSADIQYDRSSATVPAFGPLVGFDIYQGASRVATAGFDSMTNDFLAFDPTINTTTNTPEGLQPIGPTTTSPQTWYNVLVSLDFVSKVYHVFVDGVAFTPAAGLGFVTPSATTITDADLAILFAGNSAASLAATATGYYDNYSVSTGAAVPEPTTLGLLFLGGLGVLARRRNRA